MITVAAVTAVAVSAWFVVDYSIRAPWWRSQVGISIVATVACIGLLGVGTLIRLHLHSPTGDGVIVAIYSTVSAVIIWRDRMMRAVNRTPKE